MSNSLWLRPKELAVNRKLRICIISDLLRYTQIVEHILLEISVPFDFLNFQLNGSLFGNSTISGFSGAFPWKFPYHLSPFRKFRKFWYALVPKEQLVNNNQLVNSWPREPHFQKEWSTLFKTSNRFPLTQLKHLSLPYRCIHLLFIGFPKTSVAKLCHVKLTLQYTTAATVLNRYIKVTFSLP